MTENLREDLSLPLKVSIPANRRKLNQSLTFDENKSFSNSSLAGVDHSSYSDNARSQKDIEDSPCMIPSKPMKVAKDGTPVVSFTTASSEHSLERIRDRKFSNEESANKIKIKLQRNSISSKAEQLN